MTDGAVAIAAFPGENGADDLIAALRAAGGDGVRVSPAEPVPAWARVVVLPGGFAHGDALRPGALARLSPLAASLQRFVAAGGAVLGICNGFQVLLETGLLPGALRPNRSGRFLSRRLQVTVERTGSPFLRRYRPGQRLWLPVAHRQGRYWAPAEVLVALEREGAVAIRYGPPAGDGVADGNPNGSIGAVAGLTGAGGRVLGLMPHPERAADPLLGDPDGAPLIAAVRDLAAGRRP